MPVSTFARALIPPGCCSGERCPHLCKTGFSFSCFFFIFSRCTFNFHHQEHSWAVSDLISGPRGGLGRGQVMNSVEKLMLLQCREAQLRWEREGGGREVSPLPRAAHKLLQNQLQDPLSALKYQRLSREDDPGYRKSGYCCHARALAGQPCCTWTLLKAEIKHQHVFQAERDPELTGQQENSRIYFYIRKVTKTGSFFRLLQCW